MCRKHIVKLYNNSHGPGYKNIQLCVNETDFLTLEPLKDIPSSQFFSFKENDGIIEDEEPQKEEAFFQCKQCPLLPGNRSKICCLT